ncbi:NRDE family protein [Neobacillus sp. LXY-4]|uniref:NRDE family protein n=1 Tax=Neobacillus sp. LXY-4 TaxID=3379826 RepID=UPI003EE00FEE
MCLILFAYKIDPEFKLVVAANRDEFYERPTASVHFWQDHPHILAGRDLKQLGTWIGITTTGRFAALTNYRDPSEVTEGKRSRGELVGDFLKEDNTDPEVYLEKVTKNKDKYPGFNLLIGDKNDLYYYSNKSNEVKKLEPGIYGLSNHLLNTDWPKVKRGIVGLEQIINQRDAETMDERLLNLLQNADPAPDESLPKTGVSLEWERVLSPMFIKSEGYGTRSSTVLKMTNDYIHITERVFSSEDQQDQQFTVMI